MDDPPQATLQQNDNFPTFRKLGRLPKNLWQRGRKARRILLWLCVLIVALHIGVNLWASLRLNRELMNLRNQGQPLTLQELSPPTLSDQRNAALLYQQANDLLSPEIKKILAGGEPLDFNGLPRTLNRQELAKNHAAVVLIRQAVRLPDCRFVPIGDNPFTARYPHLEMMRRLERLMCAQALQEAADGQQVQALGDVQVIFQMSQHLKGEATLIGLLTRNAIENVAYKTLGKTLKIAKLTSEQGHALLQSLPLVDWKTALPRVMGEERVFGIWGFETVRRDPSQGIIMLSGGDEHSERPSMFIIFMAKVMGLLWSPISKLDELQYLHYMQRVVSICSEPPFAPQPTTRYDFDQEIPRYAVLTRIVAPVYESVVRRRDEAEVEQRLSEVAVALCVYRTQTGHYPTHLAEVIPIWGSKLPLDPHSNQPFIYKLTAHGFELYGVGPNRRDDGGTNKKFPADDILWPPGRR